MTPDAWKSDANRKLPWASECNGSIRFEDQKIKNKKQRPAEAQN